MSETLHEMAVRLRRRCGGDCTGCKYNGTPCLISVLCHTDNAEEKIEALKRWASEHPKKTWLDLLREKLPDSRYAKDHGTYPSECPSVFLGGDAPHYVTCSTSDCRECWNMEVIE